MVHRSRWAAAAVLVLFLTTAYAQVRLAPVVVTASRIPEVADEALAPVIVIPSEEIERSQATDVADLLRFQAGIDIGRNGGPGQPASVFLRGTNSNHALVLLDGVRINPGTIGGAALQDVNPALIERIEVVEGPRSALYGSDAIGGVINIITKRGTEGLHAQAAVEAGSFDTREISASITQVPSSLPLANAGGDGIFNNTRAGLAVSSYDTRGFPTHSGSNIDRGYDNLGFTAFAGTHADTLLGPVDIEVRHWQAQGKVEYLDLPSLNPLDEDFQNSVSALTLKAHPTGRWATSLQLSRMTDDIDQNQSPDFAHTRRYALDWQNDVGLGQHHLLTGGVYLSWEHAASSVFGSRFDVDTDVNAVYLQDSAQYGPHQVQLAARSTFHEAFGRHNTWNLAYGYQWRPDTRVIASAGTAFRAPDATDRFGFGGNPDLQPETSRNLELSLRQRLGAHAGLAVNLFQNDIDQLILFTSSPAFPDGREENVGRARIRGLEARAEGGWGRWRARLSGVLQDPRDRDSDEPLPRRAWRSLAASLTYDAGRYRLGADLLAASRRKDSAFSDVQNGGYGLVNLTAELSLSRRWTLQGRIENLLDKDYQLAAGFNTPGRSFFVGVRYAL